MKWLLLLLAAGLVISGVKAARKEDEDEERLP